MITVFVVKVCIKDPPLTEWRTGSRPREVDMSLATSLLYDALIILLFRDVPVVLSVVL